MTLLERSIEILGDLIACPSVSSDSNLDIITYCADRLRGLGAQVDVIPDETGLKANLFATLGPQIDGGIILSGHTDVVPVTDQEWDTDPFTLIKRDGRLFGRGTSDMKGFLAASLALAETVDPASLRLPLHFAFTYEEETGCIGAQRLTQGFARFGLNPAMTLVGEPTLLKPIEGHKGCCEYTTTFHGRPGHSSVPEAGVNAAEYAVRFANKLMDLREEMKQRAPADSPFIPPWTTSNIGAIDGGIAHNVIAPTASVKWEFRPISAQDFTYFKSQIEAYVTETLLPQMRMTAPEAQITTQIVGEVDGFEPATDNPARDLIYQLTGANSADVVAFGTEAGLFQKIGIPTIICGPGSIEQAHKANEFLDIAQLDQCLTLLGKIAQGLKS